MPLSFAIQAQEGESESMSLVHVSREYLASWSLVLAPVPEFQVAKVPTFDLPVISDIIGLGGWGMWRECKRERE